MNQVLCCFSDKSLIAPISAGLRGDSSLHGDAKDICLKPILKIPLRCINARKKLGAGRGIEVSGLLWFLNIKAPVAVFGFSPRGQGD